MKIVIDLQGCQTESRFRGIGRYSMALSKEIVNQAGADDVWLVLNDNLSEAVDSIKQAFIGLIPENQIISFASPYPVINRPENFWRVRAAELLREAFLANLQPDLVLISSLFEDAVTSIGIMDKDVKTAVMLYDLIPLANENIYLPGDNEKTFYHRKIESLKRSDLILSISEYSRQEGLNLLGLDPERVVNISTAVDSQFHPVTMSQENIKTLLEKYGIEKPFILYTGGFDSRKNLSRLFEAFSLLPVSIKNNYQLFLAGKITQDIKQLLIHQTKKWGITDSVIIGDYIPDDDLIGLYNLCALFVFPSIHEGFGLPALEAMACGAPVIGSQTTSIPEVIGFPDALFDPLNPFSLAEKIAKVLTDTDFQNILREHGLNQAKLFTWESCAKRAWNAFETRIPKSTGANRSDLKLKNGKKYELLLSSLTNIHVVDVKPTNIDLMLTARSIYKNETTVDQALKLYE